MGTASDNLLPESAAVSIFQIRNPDTSLLSAAMVLRQEEISSFLNLCVDF
nr:MAG TPA: hypothetical protein [Bacteriophage sp.]